MLTKRDHILQEVADVAKWLRNQTLDLKARGSSLACHIVTLDKELYSTLSLHAGV